MLLISFFVGDPDAIPIFSSRSIEIVFLVSVEGCRGNSSLSDEFICGVVSANPIGTLDVTNNKIAIKDRRIFN
jgi:hypothetical protein